MAAISTQFADLLDPRLRRIFDERFDQLPDMKGRFYNIVDGASGPTKADYRVSQVGTFGDIPEFSGSVTYDDVYQGYDSTITPKEYASGFQVERKLHDDDLTNIIDGKPKALATAFQRTQQTHAASTFNNAFSLDSTWLSHTEGVALCSNSHTTTSGASVATGFDNLATGSFSTVALASARIQMIGFRGDRAERISVVPSMILHPPDMYQTVHEVL